jgi:hypothetical protein
VADTVIIMVIRMAMATTLDTNQTGMHTTTAIAKVSSMVNLTEDMVRISTTLTIASLDTALATTGISTIASARVMLADTKKLIMETVGTVTVIKAGKIVLELV